MSRFATTEVTGAEVVGPLDVLRVAGGHTPCIFHRTPRVSLVGLGRAVTYDGERGVSLRDLVERVRCQLHEETGSDHRSDDLVILFRVAFDPDAAGGDGWSRFGRIRAVAPQVMLRWQRERLTIHRLGSHDLDPLLDEAATTSDVPTDGKSPNLCIETPASRAYRSGIRRAKNSDELEKAVIARTADVSADAEFAPYAVVDALSRQHPSARIFSISPAPEAPTFVGASPERLVRLRDTRATTVALAGTADCRERDPEDVAETLRRSAKDRGEHACVRRMIVETLEGLGADVSAPADPRPTILPDVVHLETPIEADVPETLRATDLVDALHPTPAVCGTPREPALELIREVEPFDRGFYAGVLGWTTLAGDGDATVALRCGLVDGRRARLFAGGGITADSAVDAEVAETEAKFTPMLTALREGCG